MNVLFLNPPEKFTKATPTLSLAYLSAAVKKAGHDSKIIDLWACDYNDCDLKKIIEKYNPEVIGIPFYTRRYNNTKNLFDKVKRWFPNVVTVAGGPHPSALPEETLNEIPAIDYVVIGEGERTVVEFIDGIGKQRDMKDVPGIAYRKNNEIIITNEREYIKNLDLLPYPDLDQFDFTKYRSFPPYGWYGRTLTMVTTRGCPGRCIFCSKSVYKNTIRSFSAKRVVEEIKYWQNKYEFKELRFYDDDFTLLKNRTFEICDYMLKEKVNLPWTCTTRVDFLSKELLVAMKQAGLYFIALGVESGSPRILKVLNKGYTVEQIRNAFKWCREIGIKTFAYFIIGNPGETMEDVHLTLTLQKEIKPNYVVWGTLRVLPGSHLYESTKGQYDPFKDSDTPYHTLFRTDWPEKNMYSICRKAMFSHYTTFFGLKSIIDYCTKVGGVRAVSDYLRLIRGKL